MKPQVLAPRVVALFVVTSCGLGLSGCPRGPVITSWMVQPSRVCPTEPVRVAWQTTNATVVTVTSSRPTEPALPVPAPLSHEQSVSISGTTEFSITARDTTKSAPRKDPEVADIVTGSDSALLTFTWNGCIGAGAGRFSEIDLVGQYSDGIRIRGITNLQTDRNVSVSHGGRSVLLAPGETSSALNGLPMGGLWSVNPELLSGRDSVTPRQEGCEPTGSLSPGIILYVSPPSVGLRVAYGCG